MELFSDYTECDEYMRFVLILIDNLEHTLDIFLGNVYPAGVSKKFRPIKMCNPNLLYL